MRLKSSKVTRTVNEEKDTNEFTLSIRIVDMEDENEAEDVRNLLKRALVKHGGQTAIEDAKDL